MAVHVDKANSSNPYRVDDRVTVAGGVSDTTVSIFDGPTIPFSSGTRVNADQWPTSSGT